MSKLYLVNFIAIMGPTIIAAFYEPQDADGLYDRGCQAREGFNTERDGLMMPFSFADGFGQKYNVNLINYVLIRTDSHLYHEARKKVSDADEAAAEACGASRKVGI